MVMTLDNLVTDLLDDDHGLSGRQFASLWEFIIYMLDIEADGAHEAFRILNQANATDDTFYLKKQDGHTS